MSSLHEGHTLDQVLSLRRYECERMAVYNNISTTEEVCPREFDGWTCINETLAGHVAYFPCPFFIFGFDPKRHGQRVCLEDGSWFKHPESNKTWSNYTTCVDLEDLQLRTQVNLIYKTGYAISLAALTISIIVFFYFKSLTCTRIQIHKNLFISLALNNCLWLVWYEAVVDNLPVLMENRIECQVLHIMVQYFLVATYFWMFCEGLYLHTLLVVTFVTEAKVMPILYPIGWGVPAVLVALYTTLRSSRREEKLHCWIHESLYSWTLSGPVCVSILANLVFLINIVRVLLTKLHTSQSSPKHASFRESLKHASFRSRRKPSSVSQSPAPPSGRTKKAVRATLILIPLLGLQYIVMPFRPEQGAAWEAFYQLSSAVIVSCQGLCVALLFCFCNGEVVAAVTKKWKQCRFKKRPCHSCTGVTSVSFSRSSYAAQEMVPVTPFQEPQDCEGFHNVQL